MSSVLDIQATLRFMMLDELTLPVTRENHVPIFFFILTETKKKKLFLIQLQ